jgi:hypothetical protein
VSSTREYGDAWTVTAVPTTVETVVLKSSERMPVAACAYSSHPPEGEGIRTPVRKVLTHYEKLSTVNGDRQPCSLVQHHAKSSVLATKTLQLNCWRKGHSLYFFPVRRRNSGGRPAPPPCRRILELAGTRILQWSCAALARALLNSSGLNPKGPGLLL